MENKIKKAMLEIKVTQLADDVAIVLLMEDVSFEFMKKQQFIDTEQVTKHMSNIHKMITKVSDHQNLAMAYNEKEVVSQCFELKKVLYKILNNFRSLTI